MPLPLTVSCVSKIQIGFTFLVPAHLGSPGKGPLNGCVCVVAITAELLTAVDVLRCRSCVERWNWSGGQKWQLGQWKSSRDKSDSSSSSQQFAAVRRTFHLTISSTSAFYATLRYVRLSTLCLINRTIGKREIGYILCKVHMCGNG